MRRLMLPRGKCITIGVCAMLFLGLMRLTREVAWNEYPSWRGDCQVAGVSLAEKEGSMVAVDLVCQEKRVSLLDQKKVLAYAKNRLSPRLKCVVSRNETVQCE